MKVFYSPGARLLASDIALPESGVELQCEPVDLKAKTVSGKEFIEINLKGRFIEMMTVVAGRTLQ